MEITIAFSDMLQNQISDERQQCNEVIDLVRRLNFSLLSLFKCIILCPVHLAHSVKEIFTTKEAILVQDGYIHHKKATSNRQGMTTIVINKKNYTAEIQ